MLSGKPKLDKNDYIEKVKIWKHLNLETLEICRLNHIRHLCRKIVTGNAQSSILDLFQLNKDGSLQAIVNARPRISYGCRHFCLLDERIYKEH